MSLGACVRAKFMWRGRLWVEWLCLCCYQGQRGLKGLPVSSQSAERSQPPICWTLSSFFNHLFALISLGWTWTQRRKGETSAPFRCHFTATDEMINMISNQSKATNPHSAEAQRLRVLLLFILIDCTQVFLTSAVTLSVIYSGWLWRLRTQGKSCFFVFGGIYLRRDLLGLLRTIIMSLLPSVVWLGGNTNCFGVATKYLSESGTSEAS